MTHIIRIRPYKETDLDAVLSSWETANKIAHPFLSESFVDTVREAIPTLYLPNADTRVADVDGKTVGFISLIGHEVGAIFVDPAYHGMGVGRALMDKACSLHPTLELEVFKENSIGRKFYDRYGFIIQSEARHEASGQQVLRLVYTPASVS